MKSWSELTEKEKMAVMNLSFELAGIFEAMIDELVPLFECILDILVTAKETLDKELAKGDYKCFTCGKLIRSTDELGKQTTAEDGTQRFYCKECCEHIEIMKDLEVNDQ